MLRSWILFLSYCLGAGKAFTTNSDATRKQQYQIQNGPCTYTFLLPETQNCGGPSKTYTEQVQRDDPVDWNRLEQLESIIENNTQWLQKLENYIEENLKQDMVQIQNNAVQNHTVTMIKIGTSLLSQTAEQSRKITTVEAQVINQTTRIERQLLENSISTSKLEKEFLQQINEINKLKEKNSFLEKGIEDMEGKRNTELETLKEEKEELKKLVEMLAKVIKEMEQQVSSTSSDNTAMKQQQQELTNTVNNLIQTISVTRQGSNSAMMQDNPDQLIDCAVVFKQGNKKSGVYSLTIPGTKQQFKAYCDMGTDGGGWTVIQKRFNGLVDFHQTWKNYTMGFGDISGEHWLGNEIISKLTQEKQHTLRIDLMDWEGNTAFSKYSQFSLDGEKQNYRISLNGYSGTAGRTSSMGQTGGDFSAKDLDNDKCVCKCSQMLSGGWWFDACGPSNLNGIYYQQGQNTNRFNGIKWYYWKGSAYSLKATTMMIRPANF
ncbi:angiopoietin-2a precursor [Danio rerio]|uniref:Angiopoietin 2-like protein n=1 Tax=Danio rerio TaxID=7955 RepID=I6Z0F9_DANRE|nr:angiopoietin-2a precursor [Danio rerio]AFN70711.1 angiopoietin 2-like protein [Danio rerio]|eukprot:NP_001265754.1 angiopoietin-2 precursor [Danio rerio]